MSLIENIFTSLIMLTHPGNNVSSQVPISYCDDVCQSTTICDNKSYWNCNTPKFNNDIFKEKTEKIIEEGLSREQAEKTAYNLSFTRPETYEEALARYYIIATAIEKVSGELSKEKCLQENTDKTVCKGKPWYWDQRSLAMLVATLVVKESGLASDVHGGLHSGLGDCHWYYKDGLYGEHCQSYSVGQVKQVAINAHHLGYDVKEIVGLDLISTEKAIRAISYSLSGARGMCKSIEGAFSIYGTGNTCKLKKLNDRAKVFYMLLNSKKTITGDVLEIMSGKRYKEVYNLLLNSNKQIHQLPPVKFEQIELNKFIVTN